MLSQDDESFVEVSGTGQSEDQCRYIYCTIVAKLTSTSFRLLKDDGELRKEVEALGVQIDDEQGEIRCNDYENLIKARLLILKLILDQRRTTNASPEVASNSELPSNFDLPSHVVSQPTEQQDFTNALANEVYYMYELKGCSGYWRKNLERLYKVNFNVSPKSDCPSISGFCKPISHKSNNAQAAGAFFSTLTMLRQKVSIIVFPLPAAFTRNSNCKPKELELSIEGELNKWPENNNQSASAQAQPSLQAAVFANFSAGHLICVCKNELVQRVEFAVRRMIRENVIQNALKSLPTSRALIFATPQHQATSASANAIPCTFNVLSVDITLLPVDVHVNVLEGDLRCYGGLSLAFLNAAGPEMQTELLEIYDKFNRVPVPVGNAVCTRSYALPSDFVVHAIGPDGKDYRFFTNNSFQQALIQTYLSVLKLAADLYPKDTQISLALPLLSAGNYRGSHTLNECTEALSKALDNAFQTSLLARFKVIYLVNLSLEVTKAVEAMFQNVQLHPLASDNVPHMDGKKFLAKRSEDRRFDFYLSANGQKTVQVYSTKSAAELYPDSYRVDHLRPLVKDAPEVYQNQTGGSGGFFQKARGWFTN